MNIQESMDKRLFVTLTLFSFMAALLYGLYLLFNPFLPSLIWAGVLVVVFYPLYNRLLTRLHHRENLASLLMCLGITLVVLLPLSFLAVILVQQVADGAQDLIESVQKIDFSKLTRQRWMTSLTKWLSRYVDLNTLNLQAELVRTVRTTGEVILSRSTDIFKLLSGMLLMALLVQFNMFFLFRDGVRLLDYLKSLIPVSDKAKNQILDRTGDIINASITAGLLAGIVQGFMGGLAFALCGIPSTLFWGCVMCLLGFIPVAGMILVWLPADIWLFWHGKYFEAIFLLIWCTAGLNVIDNLVRPFLIRQVSKSDTRLNTFLLFLAVLGGIQLFGLLGIVLGPLLIVFVMTTIDITQATFGHLPLEVEMDAENVPVPE